MKANNYHHNSKSQKDIPFVEYNYSTSSENNTSKFSEDIQENILSNLFSLTAKFEKLEQENIQFKKQLEQTIDRENKLINRFCWLLRIINWSSVIIMIIVVIIFINAFYPFIKKLIEDDVGVKVVLSIVGSAIGAGICSLWWTFNKYVNKVIEREKN